MTQNSTILIPKIALYEPDIPQNTGNIFRLGACLGISVDIIEPTGYIFHDKRFKRSSMDYIKHIDYKRHLDWDIFFSWSKKNNFRLILLTTKADEVLWDFKFKDTDTLVMGRESAGVPTEVHNACDAHIKLPMFGKARSLNVAMTAGMAISEALKQTR